MKALHRLSTLALFFLVTPALMAAEPRRAVDVVICLDVSGSMEDLLDATRGAPLGRRR